MVPLDRIVLAVKRSSDEHVLLICFCTCTERLNEHVHVLYFGLRSQEKEIKPVRATDIENGGNKEVDSRKLYGDD